MDIQEEIKNLQQEIESKNKALIVLKLKLGGAVINDYTLYSKEGEPVQFYSLFGDKDELLIIHNMGKGCNYCTLWADGFNGTVNHFKSRTNWALVSPDEPTVLKQFAESRNWNFDVYSCKDSTFKKDLGFVLENGSTAPGFSVFKKDTTGKVIHYAYDWFGPGDYFSSIWHFMQYLPNGNNGWRPQLKY